MPVDEKVFRRYDNATIRAANSIIKEVCATRPNCTFLDARKALMDESGGFDPRLHQGDGLHPTAEAYRRWAATIAPALAPLHRL
jgi:lysophospholipase L1-like esterase